MSGLPYGMAPYPLALEPQLHRRVWGGEWLKEFHGGGADLPEHGPEGEPVGESWLADGASVVRNGAYAGRSVGELAAQLGAELVGTVPHERYGPRMPLLAKLLDAATALSVQVHPDDTYALSEERASGHLGKSEAWYVLSAEPGASVLWGFRQRTTGDVVRGAVAGGTLPELMQQVQVRPGSVVVNPAGTVHAVGAGIRLYEIQQASDLTYRLYDHGRVGADGQPRQLHLDKSLAVADLSGVPFEQRPARPLEGGWERLVQRPEFVLDRAQLSAGSVAAGSVTSASLQLITLICGEAVLEPSEGAAHRWDALHLSPGSTVLLPAGLARVTAQGGARAGVSGPKAAQRLTQGDEESGGGYVLRGDGEILRSSVPPPTHHVREASETEAARGPHSDQADLRERDQARGGRR